MPLKLSNLKKKQLGFSSWACIRRPPVLGGFWNQRARVCNGSPLASVVMTADRGLNPSYWWYAMTKVRAPAAEPRKKTRNQYPETETKSKDLGLFFGLLKKTQKNLGWIFFMTIRLCNESCLHQGPPDPCCWDWHCPGSSHTCTNGLFPWCHQQQSQP